MTRLKIWSVLTCVLSGMVQAATVGMDQILVNPKVKSLQLSVFTGRDLTGKAQPKYQKGEKLRIAIRTNQDAYVYLFALNPDGKIALLLPHLSEGGNNLVKAQRTKYFPNVKNTPGNLSYQLATSSGIHKILAVASKQKLALKTIAKFEGTMATSLIKGQDTLINALQFALQDVEDSVWTADTIYYEVIGEAQASTNLLATAQPWSDKSMWSANVDLGPSLSVVFKHYDAQVLAAGYTRRSIKNISSADTLRIRGEYLRDDGKKAVLKVSQQKNNYRITFDRQR